MRATAVVLGLLAGCGPTVSDAPAGDGSGGIVLETTSSSGGADSTLGGADSDSSAADASTEVESIPPDVPEPQETFVACSDQPAVLNVDAATTPDGPSMIVDGYASYDFCSRAVYIALVPEDTGVVPLPSFKFLVDQDAEWGDTYSGVYDTRGGGPAVPSAVDAVEFLQPWDSTEAFDADADPTLHVRLELHQDGWDVSAEAIVPFCADRVDCFCPCE